ncbi:hypothetical protein INT43_001274 [Umbelopsis isabellina]|uniref:FAD-binding domain-containing protein n=1 Tax=Mortierella isabellina TaxID=91625 RepID=A0A8H7UBM6_MORIS|nr:hypothetical protein INT43_001274 [Umbelopsis isabellina]
MEQKSFKAIIVGGSIAGLTLALAFEKANIDYILLEKGTDFAPELGASIGIFCNGMRVMDQLGLKDTIKERTEPMEEIFQYTGEGKLFSSSKMFKHLEERHGYAATFFERRNLLKILYEAQPQPSKLLGGKHVQTIEDDENGVTVTTKDGSVYKGDIVIGADGVWSRVRQSMWKAMERDGQTKDLAHDKQGNCLFGIAHGVNELPSGCVYNVYRPGTSFLVPTGKDGRTYFFYFEKLDTKYRSPNIPRYTEEDAIKTGESQINSKITDTINFGVIWNKRKHAVKVALEEGVFKRWHYGGRYVTLGDAAHKFTPNMGQGGNSAIESAAVLANCLRDALQKYPSGISAKQINEAFKLYQKDRHPRVKTTFERASELTKIEAMSGCTNILKGRYLYPRLGDGLKLKMAARAFAKAPSLNYIEKAKTPHTIPYDDEKPKHWLSVLKV